MTSRTRLVHGDNPETPDVVEPNYLRGTGTNRITNLNPADGTVINVTEGCNKSTSAPFLFPTSPERREAPEGSGRSATSTRPGEDYPAEWAICREQNVAFIYTRPCLAGRTGGES